MCYTCGAEPTCIFNNDRLSCTECREERLADESRIDTEDDMWWPLADWRHAASAAA